MSHLCVPSSEHAKMILEAHHSRVVENFGIEKIVEVLQKYFYCPKIQQDVDWYIRYYTSCAIAKQVVKK